MPPCEQADGMEVRHGGVSFGQLGVAVMHGKLDPMVANFMKIQEIYG